jgi:hypothetical protein
MEQTEITEQTGMIKNLPFVPLFPFAPSSLSFLFVSERSDRIDFHRPPRREVTSQEGDQGQ